MTGENGSEVLIEFSLKYTFTEDGEEAVSGAEATGRLERESLSILPRTGEALLIPLRDVARLNGSEHRLFLELAHRETLEMSHLGYRYEDVLREIIRAKNELMIEDFLMKEGMQASGIKSHFIYNDGENALEGFCQVRLYDTALLILPDQGDVIRIPYSEIAGISAEDYTLSLNTDYGESAVFSRLGQQYDFFQKKLSDALNSLHINTQAYLGELLPGISSSLVRRAARLMKDGKAVHREELVQISPELWTNLEKHLEAAGIKEEYDLLRSLSPGEDCCIGFKRGLAGDLTGEYIWFLIPICNPDASKPGNAVAMEAAAGEGGGRATYFFRLMDRETYAKGVDPEELRRATALFIPLVNRCMLAINFRREPVYLPRERFSEPRYTRYRYALERIPSLEILRDHFIGRVIHRSSEQWEENVRNLLNFNIQSRHNEEKWTPGTWNEQDEPAG